MPKGERFLFDVSFDEENLTLAEAEAAANLVAREVEIVEAEEDVLTFTEDQLNAARNEGYEAGREAGIQEAGDAIETKINESLGVIGSHLDELFRRQAIDMATTFTDAVNIAVTISRKCFPHLNDTHGFPEVERMVSEVLTEVIEEPRVIIHINPSLKDPLESRIKSIARTSNFEGQIIILEADDLALGDCRITWSSGTAEREMESTLSTIGQIVEANLVNVREDIAEEVATEIKENKIDIQPTLSPVTENIGKLGPANIAGRMEPASAPPPTLVDDINSLAAEIVAEARPQAPDSALPTPEATNTELEPAAAGTASPSEVPQTIVEESPESSPPPPSSQLIQKAFESQNSGNFPENESADQQIQEDITRTLTPVFDNERAAITENQLQAEPGNVEQNTNGAIINKHSASADAEDERAFDPTGNNAPPMDPKE
ncbi:MAG: hypothetical protein CMF67_02805 [Magnetovibrio sp.]|nr:hypothetical protein [Magnetovibrio sp.]